MQLYSNWKSVLQTLTKTSNAELFSNQPLYFKYCWAIFHKRASVSTFLILQQSPQFIFEQLCKNPPVLLQSFLVMNDAQLILILAKLILILTKLISHIFLSDIWCYTSVAVIPSRDDFLSILGYPLCPSISLLGHIFHQIILPLENIIVTTDAYEQDFPRVGISRYVFCELWSWGPGSLCQKASKLKRCCLKQVI